MVVAIVLAVLAINLLVLVHELGHFLVAKRRGMTVEVFSIGMGPRIFGVKYKGTEYRVSWILVGGYVKFLGDEPEDDKDPRNIPGGFFSTSPWTRILVCCAGGFANIILAFVLYTVIFYTGKPVTMDYLSAVIGEIKPGSTADEIGLRPGDRIVSINGKPVKTWEGLVRGIAFSAAEEVSLNIERGGKIFARDVLIAPDAKTGIKQLGVYPKYPVIVGGVLEGSPAEKAGLLKGDRIVGINTEAVFRIEPLIGTIRESEGKEVTLTVLRGDRQLEISAVPVRLAGQDFVAVGFIPTTLIIHPGPLEQFWHDLSVAGYTLKALFTRRLPVKAMSGPVEIVKYIGVSAMLGWGAFISFIALISLNLGIINLLPIPVLDGGHIVFTLVEVIRRRPLSLRVVAKIQNVFMVLIIMLFLYITYHNILRW